MIELALQGSRRYWFWIFGLLLAIFVGGIFYYDQPMRILNVFLYPTPGSMLFWDANVLSGYLVLNIMIGGKVLEAEHNGTAPPAWIKPLIYISIPMAFSIHTVTAFLYCGLPGRGFWLTAILPPRFLASAFASRPALLILLCKVIQKFTKFDPGEEAIQTLAKIVTYGLIANIFFCGTWIDKGLGMMAGGFIPSPLHRITEYTPSMHELLISVGVAAIGLLVLTMLYKITIRVKEYSESGLQ